MTGFPEMLDGRVKTLHPRVHGGLLARRDVPAHMQALAEHQIDAILIQNHDLGLHTGRIASSTTIKLQDAIHVRLDTCPRIDGPGLDLNFVGKLIAFELFIALESDFVNDRILSNQHDKDVTVATEGDIRKQSGREQIL